MPRRHEILVSRSPLPNGLHIVDEINFVARDKAPSIVFKSVQDLYEGESFNLSTIAEHPAMVYTPYPIACVALALYPLVTFSYYDTFTRNPNTIPITPSIIIICHKH